MARGRILLFLSGLKILCYMLLKAYVILQGTQSLLAVAGKVLETSPKTVSAAASWRLVLLRRRPSRMLSRYYIFMDEWWLLCGICSTEYIPSNLINMTFCKVYSVVMHSTDLFSEPYTELDFTGILLVAAEKFIPAVDKDSVPENLKLYMVNEIPIQLRVTDLIKV